MKLAGALATAAILLTPLPARAEPDPVLAVVVGTATEIVGFAAGTALLGQGSADRGLSRAGWLTMEAGFTLAPFAAHAVNGEWIRGALFSVVPAGSFVGTSVLFTNEPDAIDRGDLHEQRIMWGFFVLAIASSAVGIFDAALAPKRMHVAPVVTPQSAGIVFGGAL